MEKRKTLNEIADEIGVSRITISKVINRREGVSQKTAEKVLEALQRNNYKNLRSISNNSFISDEDFLLNDSEELSDERDIALLCIAPSVSDFWLEITQSITKEIPRFNREVKCYFLSRENRSAYKLPSNLKKENTSGLIVINVYDNLLINEIETLNIPTVFLDVTPYRTHKTLPGDIFILDGYYSMMEITSQFLRNGQKEIGFLGDINYSQTNYDRWRGFKQAFKNYNQELPKQYCFTSTSEHFFTYEDIKKCLDRLPKLPRAFVCANDEIAYYVAIYAQEKGYAIPDDLMLAGYDNNRKLPGGIGLTSADVDTELLGLRLVQQLFLRLKMEHAPKELIYLQPKIYYRRSTHDVNPKRLQNLKFNKNY